MGDNPVRTILFHKGVRVVGVMLLAPGMALTPEHRKRLASHGIGVLEWLPLIAHNDGDVNHYVDHVTETGGLGNNVTKK